MKQLLRILFFITIAIVIYIIEIIIDNILYHFLFFLFISGLFSVSAGANIPINTVSGINNIIFTINGIVSLIHKNGNNIKNSVDDIRQSILLFACTPNAVSLIPLNISINSNVSFHNNSS